MSKVLTFSRVFPSYHPRAGEPTYFVEKIYKSLNIKYWQIESSFANTLTDDPQEPKHHTIRAGQRFKEGDIFSPRVWSGKPYRSEQIVIAPDIQIKKVWDFEFTFDDLFYIGKNLYAYSSSHEALEKLATNDGLSQVDLLNWFNKPFVGQIICWNENIEYL